MDDSPAKLAEIELPELAGKTVLDIGAWDGFFSFEAERRGATRVLATDSFSWSGANWGSKAGFELAREVLGSTVEDTFVDVMDLDRNSSARSTSCCSSVSCTTCGIRCWRSRGPPR